MQGSKEYQREKRKPSSVISAKKSRKTRRRERRDLFKKVRDTKGIFQAKMASVKDKNGKDLTEADDIKKKWQEYTEELYQKNLHDPDNHDGTVIHLETDTLECELKWG